MQFKKILEITSPSFRLSRVEKAQTKKKSGKGEGIYVGHICWSCPRVGFVQCDCARHRSNPCVVCVFKRIWQVIQLSPISNESKAPINLLRKFVLAVKAISHPSKRVMNSIFLHSCYHIPMKSTYILWAVCCALILRLLLLIIHKVFQRHGFVTQNDSFSVQSCYILLYHILRPSISSFYGRL